MSPAFRTKSGPTARWTFPVAARWTLTKYIPPVSRNPDRCTVRPAAGDHLVNLAPKRMLSPSSAGNVPSAPPPPPREPLLLFPPGNNQGAATRTYAKPANATGTPYCPKSKRPIVGARLPYRSWSSPTTTRLVDVPIRVQVPPSILAKLKGMRSCRGLMCMLRPHRWTMGIITATTGVLLRNADTMDMGTIRRSWAEAGDRGRPRSLPIYQSRAPVWDIPAATTNRAMTVRSPSLAKPLIPSSTVTILAAITRVSPTSMTISAPTLSLIRATNITKRVRQVYTISHVWVVSVSAGSSSDDASPPSSPAVLLFSDWSRRVRIVMKSWNAAASSASGGG
mmetsp:Transcript_10992/g.24602  ORF Transcript_10992/g.24602 Transcript_10992/m.24602 type:complete len:337 (+) Transcript_10992:3275-4285(+)